MPLVGFEPTVSAGERPQTYALDRAATGTGTCAASVLKIIPTKTPLPLSFPSFAHTHAMAHGTISIQVTQYCYGSENPINEQIKCI